MKSYRHIFFDLDNTLWDFESNSSEMLTELFHRYELQSLGIPSPEFFIEKYKQRNEMMWEQYRLGKIGKETLRNERFRYAFWDMGIDDNLVPAGLAEEYVVQSPKKNRLFPYTVSVLDYLSQKYKLHIITNGFAEAQYVKLKSSAIDHLFDEVIISEHTGYKKPDINIFLHAMRLATAVAEECLMVGDGLEVDILGARNAGWDTVFFNPGKKVHDSEVTYEISCLSELKEIL